MACRTSSFYRRFPVLEGNSFWVLHGAFSLTFYTICNCHRRNSAIMNLRRIYLFLPKLAYFLCELKKCLEIRLSFMSLRSNPKAQVPALLGGPPLSVTLQLHQLRFQVSLLLFHLVLHKSTESNLPRVQ